MLMPSFVVALVNNSGYDLTSSDAYLSFPSYIVPSFGLIENNTTKEITIELDDPKDPCGCSWELSIAGHPIKVYLRLINPLGDYIYQLKFSYSYLENTTNFTKVKLGVNSGCTADKLEITIQPLQLITILP